MTNRFLRLTIVTLAVGLIGASFWQWRFTRASQGNAVGSAFSGNAGRLQHQPPGLASSLNAYWRFDGNYNDSSSGGHNATPGSTTTFGDGRYHKAAVFDRTDNSPLTVTYNSVFNNSAPATVTAWVNVVGDTCKTIYSVSVGENLSGSFNLLVGGSCVTSIADEIVTITRRSSSTTTHELAFTSSDRTILNDSRWHHVAFVTNGSAYTIYLDGVSRTITAGTGANDGTFAGVSGANTFTIGGRYINNDFDRQFDGSLDEVRYYSAALSENQVREEMLGSRPAEADSSLAGYWKLDEYSGGSANDATGAGNTGTLVNIPVRVAGRFGGGLKMVGGSSQYINWSDIDALDFDASTSFTVSVWTAVGTFTAGRFVTKRHISTPTGYEIKMTSGGVVEAIVHDGTDTVQASTSGIITLNTNEWYHLVLVVNRASNTMELWVNKQLIQSLSISSVDSLANSNNFRVGCNDGTGTSNCISATVDEVRVYKRALANYEIVNLYNAGSPV